MGEGELYRAAVVGIAIIGSCAMTELSMTQVETDEGRQRQFHSLELAQRQAHRHERHLGGTKVNTPSVRRVSELTHKGRSTM